MSFIDIKGNKFGKLTVLKRVGNNKYGDAMWECLCDCGNKIVTAGYRLRSGHTKSCGCYHKEIVRKNALKHGDHRSELYRKWHAMKSRCYLKSHSAYKDYGAKGIRVCEKWHDYSKFKEWALNNGFKPGLTIDRIDNNGNYDPANCHFVTREEQNRNTSRNICVKIAGKEYLLADLARITGLSRGEMSRRYAKGLRGNKLLIGGDN